MDQRSVARGRPAATSTSAPERSHTGRRLVVVTLALAVILGLALTAAWATAPRLGDPDALVRRRVASLGGRDVPLAGVAPLLLQAVVAGEDQRFYRHHGIDLLGLTRAAAYDVGHLSLAEGGSTVTEQLAKDLYLHGDDRSPVRQVQAAILTMQVDAHLSKPQILDDYLNTVYFGSGATGIDAASRRYFGVAPSALDLAQASLLAGLIRSPSTADPYVDPAASRGRQGAVLREMVAAGDVTSVQARGAMDTPLPLVAGGAIAGRPDVAVDPASAVSSWILALGAAMIVAGVVALQRRPAAAVRLASWLMVTAGVLLALRAVRGD